MLVMQSFILLHTRSQSFTLRALVYMYLYVKRSHCTAIHSVHCTALTLFSVHTVRIRLQLKPVYIQKLRHEVESTNILLYGTEFSFSAVWNFCWLGIPLLFELSFVTIWFYRPMKLLTITEILQVLCLKDLRNLKIYFVYLNVTHVNYFPPGTSFF